MIARIEGKNVDWVIFGFDNEDDPSIGPGMHFQRLFTRLDKNHGKIDVVTTLYEKEPEKIHLICRSMHLSEALRRGKSV